MTRFVSVFVAVALLNSPAYAACAEEDTLCLLKVIDERMQENQLLLRQIERYKELDSNAQKQIELLTGSNRELATASKSALEAIQASRPRFYQTAEFGLAIGIPLGVIVTVLAAVAIGYAARQLLLGSVLVAAP